MLIYLQPNIHKQNHGIYWQLQRPKHCTHWVHGFSLAVFDEADTSRPLWRRCGGKETLQLATWDLSLGMLGCALLHLWQRNSIVNNFSSFIFTAPCLSISSIASVESRKKAVLKEFQCFLFFKGAESKSWLITWRCSCLIEGTCKMAKTENEVTMPKLTETRKEYEK